VRVGDRVKVTAIWSEYRGMEGAVEQTEPCVLVLFDRDVHPIRVDAESLKVLEEDAE
jgi:hypothetical protein